MGHVRKSKRWPDKYVLTGTFSETQIMALARCALKKRNKVGDRPIVSVETCRELTKFYCGHLDNEAFGAIFLDSRHNEIHTEILFKGSIDRSVVYPRVILKKALHYNAAAMVVFHNHPSGNVNPSQMDIRLTDRLKRLLEELDIRLLDHMVIGGDEMVSTYRRRKLIGRLHFSDGELERTVRPDGWLKTSKPNIWAKITMVAIAVFSLNQSEASGRLSADIP